jgi:D-methionine transport system permease protein
MSQLLTSSLLLSLWQTLEMVIISGLVALLFGIPLGVALYVTEEGKLLPQRTSNKILGIVVNIGRSIPFIILMVAIIPFTRFVIGTSIGTAAAIVPLSISAIPFMARLVESALLEVPLGLVEATQAMGATPLQIIGKVLVPEAMPAIVRGLTLTLVTLVGYSAMAGVVGGGGLGDLAIRYGYQRFDIGVMLITVVILVVMVQFIQWVGDRIAVQLSHNK